MSDGGLRPYPTYLFIVLSLYRKAHRSHRHTALRAYADLRRLQGYLSVQIVVEIKLRSFHEARHRTAIKAASLELVPEHTFTFCCLGQ